MIDLNKQEIAVLLDLVSNVRVGPAQPNNVQLLLISITLLEKLRNALDESDDNTVRRVNPQGLPSDNQTSD